MNRFLTVYLVLVLGLTVSACSRRSVAKIDDVTRAETVILKKAPGRGAIHALSVIGEGQVTGTAEVQLILDSKVYRRETISGAFRFEFAGDWYSETAEVRYIPGDVSDGKVTLKYVFRS